MTSRSSRRAVLALCAGLLLLTGCHSHYIAATVKNASGGQVTLIEVDYPSASFGKDVLANGAQFPYRFKLIGDGPVKISWTDAKNQQHTSDGPHFVQGDEGKLLVTILPANAVWSFTPKH